MSTVLAASPVGILGATGARALSLYTLRRFFRLPCLRTVNVTLADRFKRSPIMFFSFPWALST